MKSKQNETPTLEVIPGPDSGPDALPVPVPHARPMAGGLGLARIGGIIPQTIDDAIRIATGVHKSGLAPKGLNGVEAITTVILQGLELGLPPMMSINKIAIINGRPTLWGDAVPALLWSRGFSIEEECDGKTATCTITRPTGQKVTRSFSVDDAKKAGLWGKSGPWTTYPDRMLQMRARGFAARDGAADVLGGMYLQEEVVDGGELSPFEGNSAPFKRKSSAEAKRDGTTEAFNALLAKIEHFDGDAQELLQLRIQHMDDQGNPWSGMPMRWNQMLEDAFEVKAGDLGLDLGVIE